MNTVEYIAGYIERARKAQKEFEAWSQGQVDEAVRLIAKVVYDNAEYLAGMAVAETEMGNVPDKILKNRGKAGIIWNSLKGKKSRGIIKRDAQTGITEIAKPVGVIAAITPCTNPVVTPMCNAMFALKGGNAVVITPHHRSYKTSEETVRLINEELQKIGAPENLVQIVDHQSRENTRELISAADTVVATGGMSMVKAAYSSGKPALGVGAGNVQCIIDRDVDFSEMVPKIVNGRSFDYGIICSGEQTVIVHEEDLDAVMEEFRKNSGYVVFDEQEVGSFRKAIFPNGKMNPDLVGQSTARVAELAGTEIPEDTRVILLKAAGAGREDFLSKEKMCPVLSIYTYKNFDEAIDIAEANLEYEGAGHSVSLHSHSEEHIEAAALRLKASRFVINQPSSTSAGGSWYNGFSPTTTLGCGSWGNNSISENLTYTHMINVSRIGYFMKDAEIPSEDILWNS